MTLGTGIFLSVVLLSVVLLFHTTKDRWNWRKIFKFAVVWPVSFLVAISLIGGASYYLYDQYENRPKKQVEMWGLKLGMSESDVLFAKGEPSKTGPASNPDEMGFDVLSIYDFDDGYYVIKYVGDKIIEITYGGNRYHSPKLNGLRIGDNIDFMIGHLGEPSSVIEYNEGMGRTYKYKQYSSYYSAEMQKIISMTINQSE